MVVDVAAVDIEDVDVVGFGGLVVVSNTQPRLDVEFQFQFKVEC